MGACKRRAVQDVITLRAFVNTFSNNSGAFVYENSFNLSTRNHSTAFADLGQEDQEVAGPFPSGGGGTLPEELQLLVEVGVLGVPNAGKSTLTNALAGTKVSAVSDKTNTTIRSRLGAFTAGATQVVLFDTPGIISPGSSMGLQQLKRVESAWKTASQCDVLLFVLDSHRQLTSPDPRVLRLVESLGGGTIPGLSSDIKLPPIALVLNKVDSVRKEQRSLMLPLAEQFRAMAKFDDIFWVSALRGHGVDELKEYLLERGKPKAWTVAGDASTDASELDVAAEIVREKIFRAYYKELPYEIRVVPNTIKILADGSTRIDMEIHVARDSLRRIVVGKNGAAIGSVGIAARTELEKLWKTRVHLFLKVKVEN